MTLAACSGAQTADVVRDQLTILSASTQVTDELDALIENRTEAAGLVRTDGSTSAAALNCSTSLPTRARPPTWPRTNRGEWQPCVSDTRRGGLDHALHQAQGGSLPSDQDSRIARFNRKFR